jgi:hypothetical protein
MKRRQEFSKLSPMITLSCKKLEGKYDTVTISTTDSTQIIRAWKQPILPDELVYFVAEEVFKVRGFVRLVAAGQDPAVLEGEMMGSEALLAEGLTNALQYDLAGQVTDEAEYRSLVETFCQNSQLVQPGFTPSLTVERIAAARARVRELNAQWQSLPLGEKLTVKMPL